MARAAKRYVQAKTAKQAPAHAAAVDPTRVRQIGRELSKRGSPEKRHRDRDKSARDYYCRRPFGYRGQEFDREQVIRLVGEINDEKLTRLGYVAELPEDARVFPCRCCPAKFLSMSAREAHGAKRHAERDEPLPQMEPRQRGETELEFQERERAFLEAVQADEDARLDREEKALDAVAPLYLDKTIASRDASL